MLDARIADWQAGHCASSDRDEKLFAEASAGSLALFKIDTRILAAEAEAREPDLADFIAVAMRCPLGPPEILGSEPGAFEAFWDNGSTAPIGISVRDGKAIVQQYGARSLYMSTAGLASILAALAAEAGR